MPDEAKDLSEWLSLKQAAKRLGVHPSTLRRWADAGSIRIMLTPGGHRRFASADLAEFEAKRHGLRIPSGLEQRWAAQAIDHTRREIQAYAGKGWLRSFDDTERERKRQLGRRLMGIILQYVALAEGGEALLEEARAIGFGYAEDALHTGMPLTTALEAAMFFRDSIVEVAIQPPETAHVRAVVNPQLLRRINVVLNTVQIAIAETYEKATAA